MVEEILHPSFSRRPRWGESQAGPAAASAETDTVGGGPLQPERPGCTGGGVGVAYYDFGGGTRFWCWPTPPASAGPCSLPWRSGLAGRSAASPSTSGATDVGAAGGRGLRLVRVRRRHPAVIDRFGLVRPLVFGNSCGAAAFCWPSRPDRGRSPALDCYEPVIYPGTDPWRRPLPPIRWPTGPGGGGVCSGPVRRRSPTTPPSPPSTVSITTSWGLRRRRVRARAGGHPVRCRREDEAQVYAHGLSHAAFAHLDGSGVRSTLACGAETDAVGPAFLALLDRRLRRVDVEVFAGIGHFGPMEDPDELAGRCGRRLGPRRRYTRGVASGPWLSRSPAPVPVQGDTFKDCALAFRFRSSTSCRAPVAPYGQGHAGAQRPRRALLEHDRGSPQPGGGPASLDRAWRPCRTTRIGPRAVGPTGRPSWPTPRTGGRLLPARGP